MEYTHTAGKAHALCHPELGKAVPGFQEGWPRRQEALGLEQPQWQGRLLCTNFLLILLGSG